MTQHRIELERLKFEISNLQKRLDSEEITIEKEQKNIEELNSVIEETKEEFTSREQEMQQEIKTLEQELEKANSDYQELVSRIEILATQNQEFDAKIHYLIEHNEDFSIRPVGEVYEKIVHIKKDIKDLDFKLQSSHLSPVKKNSSVVRIKEEISNLRNEKNSIINKITECKEVESIKESNISMLLTTLSNNSTAPDLNVIYKSFEDEEIFRQQQDEIEELRSKIARKLRRNQLENKRCICEIV
jgi:chromosome segregation ATPase